MNGEVFCKKQFDKFYENSIIFNKLWKHIGNKNISRNDANQIIDLMYSITHARIWSIGGTALSKYYPTPKRRIGELTDKQNLWWTFHSTGGVSEIPMISWFSGKARKQLPNGREAYRGGSTHFAILHDGTPLCFIKPTDSAWHCQRRNRDSLSVELVNACGLKPDSNGGFRWWNGKYTLPYEPEKTTKWRGYEWWQPYDDRQIVSLIKLVKLCLYACGSKRFDRSRMCQHSDFNEHKIDCGPLFPFDMVVAEIFSNDVCGDSNVDVSKISPGRISDETESEIRLMPLHGFDNDSMPCDDTTLHGSIKRIQTMLYSYGLYLGKIDGIFGTRTKSAVQTFQLEWNRLNYKDPIKIDGIPGPETMKRLFKFAYGDKNESKE